MNTEKQYPCNKKHDNKNLSPAMPLSRGCNLSNKLLSASTLLATVALSACGWVDSTGRNESDSGNTNFSVSPANSGTGNNGSVANGPTTELADTAVVQISEQATLPVVPDSRLLGAQNYIWAPVVRGNPILDCNALQDFNTTLATNNLGSACTVPDNCDIGMQAVTNEFGQQAFNISIPQLKSPAAVGYRLSGIFADGSTVDEYYALCLISINEAPLAVDDQFTVVRGETLRVNGDALTTLLTNDSDDEDTSNRPLMIENSAVQEPRFASNFRLRSDGGFVYTPAASINTRVEFDSFSYALSDGSHLATATVAIRIVESNTQPSQLALIPDLTVVAGQSIATSNSSFDLSEYFSDPDGQVLRFSTTPGSLPASGNLQLDVNGQLSGTVTDEDVGDYNVTVIVSDGSIDLTDTFILSVAANSSSSQNQAPVFFPVETLVLEQGQDINIRVNASDADGDNLTYSLAAGAPGFLSIGANNGRLRGVARQSGLFPITVIASDSLTSTSMTLLMRIISDRNRAPEVDDIANVIFDRAFSYDVSVFFVDRDNDPLSFTAQNLPAGISISNNGVISGVPSAANRGPHFIQVTADDGNLGMVTDGFRLTLRP